MKTPLIESRSLRFVRIGKAVLLSALAGLVLWISCVALLSTDLNLKKLREWSREPATIVSLARVNEIEIEVARKFADSLPRKREPEYCGAYEEGNTCLLVPRRQFGWYALFDEVDLLWNPANPKELEILSLTGLWVPVSGYLILLLVLAGAWKLLANNAWGEDRTWSKGTWITTERAPSHVGFGAADAEAIRESRSSHKVILFWNLLFLAIAGVAVPGAVMHFSSDPIPAVLVTGAILVILLLAVHTAIVIFTRTIHQDASGICDTNLFGVKRVAWSDIGTVALVNVNKEAQQRFDRLRNRSGTRPAKVNTYILSDKQGREIMRLSEHMEPQEAHHALLARLCGISPEDKGPADSKAAADFEQEWNQFIGAAAGKRKSIFHPKHRGLLLTLVAMVLPFLLITGLLVYRSLWFMYGAERAQGHVVEIKQDGLPSLVIEYSSGPEPALQIESDGTEAYGAYHVGDPITVFYEVGNPENARIDLFLELWLMPMIMGGLTLIIVIVAVLIGRGMTAPMPGR